MPVPQRRSPRQRYWLHMLLLAATCFTTLVMGARMQYNFEHNRPALSVADESIPYFPASWAWKHPQQNAGLGVSVGLVESGLMSILRSQLQPSFENSPLVRRDSYWSAGFGVAWLIRQSDRLVESDD